MTSSKNVEFIPSVAVMNPPKLWLTKSSHGCERKMIFVAVTDMDENPKGDLGPGVQGFVTDAKAAGRLIFF